MVQSSHPGCGAGELPQMESVGDSQRGYAMNVKLGIVSYTNTTSGVGCFARDIVDNLPVDSFLSVPCCKGQEKWLERQLNGVGVTRLTEYLDTYRPDVLLGIETMFTPNTYGLCRERGIRTVLVVMHEAYVEERHPPSWYLCPTQIAYSRVGASNKVYFDWPTDCRPFKFTQRTEARRFLHVMGYGSGAKANTSGCNRRQTRAVYEGFCAVPDPNISLTIHCQEDWRAEYGECHDPRVTFRLETLPRPADVYEDSDVLVQPDAFAGYDRVLLEAQACGLVVLTTDGPPMNELVRDPSLLIPARPEWYDYRSHGLPWGPICDRHIVAPADVTAAIQRVLTWDIPARSLAARANAEAHNWTDDKRADLVRLLESMVN